MSSLNITLDTRELTIYFEEGDTCYFSWTENREDRSTKSIQLSELCDLLKGDIRSYLLDQEIKTRDEQIKKLKKIIEDKDRIIFDKNEKLDQVLSTIELKK